MSLDEWVAFALYGQMPGQDYEYWADVEDQCYNDSFDDEDEAA